jgi:hypothetical protein
MEWTRGKYREKEMTMDWKERLLNWIRRKEWNGVRDRRGF